MRLKYFGILYGPLCGLSCLDAYTPNIQMKIYYDTKQRFARVWKDKKIQKAYGPLNKDIVFGYFLQLVETLSPDKDEQSLDDIMAGRPRNPPKVEVRENVFVYLTSQKRLGEQIEEDKDLIRSLSDGGDRKHATKVLGLLEKDTIVAEKAKAGYEHQ